MAATSAGRAQAAALVQGRGLVLAEVGAALWLWWASGQAALAGWYCWIVANFTSAGKFRCIFEPRTREIWYYFSRIGRVARHVNRFAYDTPPCHQRHPVSSY